MTRAFRLLFAALCIWWLAVVGLYGFAISARAHGWYPLRCCHDRDCAPIRADSITRQGDNYVITIKAGTHPMVIDADIVRTWPIERSEPSQDAEHHICLSPDQRVLCLFIPLNG
jgi:hypothetical protein